MPFQISPFGNDQFFSANGALAVGYQLFTYLGGTSQKEAVYTDQNGLASHSNPIVLNSFGMPAAPIFLLINKTYKFVYALPTDTDPPTSPIYTVDGVDVGFAVGGIPAVEWTLGDTPTYASGTTFTVPGNQTTTYQIGRRVQAISNLGTIYGTISNSVFGASTTVTILPDSGTLDATLSSVYYGFLSATGSSWPAGFTTGLATTLNGALTVPPTSNFNLLPPGLCMPFGGSNLPQGYLWCNGLAYSRITYAALFGAIGTVFGVGDGSTTFNVPDLRGRFPLGKDDMGGSTAGRVTSVSLNGANALILGAAGGEETHVLTVAELATHDHQKTLSSGSLTNSDEAGATGTTSVKRSDFAVRSAGSNAAHNNMPPWEAVNYIIRYA